MRALPFRALAVDERTHTMNIETHTAEHTPVAALKGRFDAFEVPKFNQWLLDNINADNPHAVVNLSGVEFIDSSALAALVKGLKRCREFGGDLILCEMQQAVTIIFELTRLDKAFRISQDEKDALSARSQA